MYEEDIRAVLWLLLTSSGSVTVFCVAQMLLSKEPVSIGLATNRQHTFGSLLYLALVLTGWLTIVGLGIYELLMWFPRSADEFRGMISLAVAFFSISVLMHLERSTFMRQTLAVNDAKQEWINRHLGSPFSVSVNGIEELEKKLQDASKTDTEQKIAYSILAFAKMLKERDERAESQVIYRLQREQDVREYESSQAIENATRKAEDAAQVAAMKARERELRTAINNLIRSSPTVSTIDELHEGSEAVIDDNLWAVNWDRFTNFATRALQPKAKGQIMTLLQELPGITLCDDVKLQLQYKGAIGHGDCNELNGFCDAYAIIDGETLPLYEGIWFSENIDGIINAFLLTMCLPSQWSWGHGFYDRDHQLITNLSDLFYILMGAPSSGMPKLSTSKEKWPPVGIRLIRIGNAFEIACLAFREGRGISDLSMSVVDGKASALRERDVYIWGQGVLY